MGEFGTKTEKVGPDRVAGGIFEYRGAQGKKIPLDEWTDFAVSYFLHVMRVNGHDVRRPLAKAAPCRPRLRPSARPAENRV